MFDAVSFTVLTTLLITLRAPETAPPFFEPPPRFFDDAFFAGALAGAFFDAAFFAGAFFEAFFDDAFFEEAEAFFDDAFFEAFLLAPPFFADDFFAADFFDADFLDADFFEDDFLEDDSFADSFLAAMDSSTIQNRVGGEPYVVRKKKICAAWQPRCTNFNVDEDVTIVTHATASAMACSDCNHRLRHRRSVLHLPFHPQSAAHARAREPFVAPADDHHLRRAQLSDARGHALRRRLAHHAAGHATDDSRARFERLSRCRGCPFSSSPRRRSDRNDARALHESARARHRGGRLDDRSADHQNAFPFAGADVAPQDHRNHSGHPARRADAEERDPRGLPQRRLPRAQRRQAGARHRRSGAHLLQQTSLGIARG